MRKPNRSTYSNNYRGNQRGLHSTPSLRGRGAYVRGPAQQHRAQGNWTGTHRGCSPGHGFRGVIVIICVEVEIGRTIMKKNSRIAKILQNVPTDPEIKTGCCTLQNNNVLVLDKPQNIIIKSDRSLQQSSTHQNPTSGISILFDSDLQSILPECDTLNNIATATIVTEIIHPDNIPAMNSLIQIPSHMESVEQASTLMPTTVLMNLAKNIRIMRT
ncbi:unnamed protein product [Arctia plantaginis]|uniref:Uncharacterized protein n=1 Tax=Arctia plantaginis TaxID=874455 RepID=A0A8S1ATZ6_ARCPL|nr:unnamed protein product [Arctia plantaginis]